MEDVIKLIVSEKIGDYNEYVSFKTLTTYRTGGVARLVVYPYDVSRLSVLVKFLKDNEVPFKVFGNGSNILASDKDYDGYVSCGAGYNFALLANTMSKKGYSGLEFACGIPATVGGAVYMNAGAYLSDVSNVLEKVDILDDDMNVVTMFADNLGYSYRKSIFMEKNWIILRAYFKLSLGDSDYINRLLLERKQRRIMSQPLEYPSAGSVFRNPEGNYAGKLIEDAGLRGFRVGGAMISDKHANFIINYENASSSDVKYLMDLAYDKVYSKYNVKLKREQELFNWE